MPKKIPQFLEYFLEDCLCWDSQFSTKWMFGGYWVYKNWKIFALYAYDELYFKVGDENRSGYINAWSHIFEYNKAGKKMNLWYYTLPEELLENRDKLDHWIEKSLQVVSKTKAVKKRTPQDVKLDKAILDSLLEIPKNMVTTYKILAVKFWVHSRRIASVMKYNKEPDSYPCYKVISHSRKIWWYSWPEWVDMKLEMIVQDWTKVVDEKVLEEYIYKF